MVNDAPRTIVIGNWQESGSYSRKCWEEIARKFADFDPDGLFAHPWDAARGYYEQTETYPEFLPIPLAAPGSESSDKEQFRDDLFAYLNNQNVTSLVLVCDSPYARRTLDILGPLSTRPVFVVVASNDELLSPELSALAGDYVFRLCPNNRQQAELVVMRMRMDGLRTVMFWTDEKVGSDEYRYHAEELRTFLAQSLNTPVPMWQEPVDTADTALFVAGYSTTVRELDRIELPLADASLVMFSDGCTPIADLKTVCNGRSGAFAIRSSVEPRIIARETVAFLKRYGNLTPRHLAITAKDLSSLGTVPVSFHGTDNSAIPFNLTPLRNEEA